MRKILSTIVMAALLLLPLVSQAQNTATITIAVNNATMGTTTPTPGTYTYNYGDQFSVTAIPNSGYELYDWTMTFNLYGQTITYPVGSNTLTLSEIIDDASWDGLTLTAMFQVAGTTPDPDSIDVNLGVATPSMGHTDPVPGHYRYAETDGFTAVAIPEPGCQFVHWTMGFTMNGQYDYVPISSNDTITHDDYADFLYLIGDSIDLIALFDSIRPTDSLPLTIIVDPTYSFGHTSPAAGTYYMAEGDNYDIDFIPDSGYYCKGYKRTWIQDGVERSNVYWYHALPPYYDMYYHMGDVLYSPTTIRAYFGSARTPLSFICVNAYVYYDGGSVMGTGTYNFGDTVTLVATPAPGYHFVGWIDATSYNGVSYDTVSHDMIYSFVANVVTDGSTYANYNFAYCAVFEYGETEMENLVIGVNNPSLGTTNPAPGTHQYSYGSVVTLTAIPNEGNSFVRWTDEDGATLSMENPYTFGIYTTGGTQTIIAHFVQGEYIPDSVTLTVAINNSSMGTTTPAPGTYTFAENAMVQFLATPYDGYFVMGWELQANYMGMTIRDTLFGENEFSTDFFDLVDVTGIVLTALFTDDSTYAPDRVYVTINTNSPTMGTTNPAPGTYTYYDGDEITITAIPNEGYRIVDWTLTVTMYGQTYTEPLGEPLPTLTYPVFVDDEFNSYTITAIFGPDNVSADSLAVSVGVDYPHRGTVTPAAGTYNYGEGDIVTVSATANPGYFLTGWHVTVSHPVLGIVEDEVMNEPIPSISFEVDEDMLGFVYSIVALFGASEGIEDATSVAVNAYSKDGQIILTGAEGREVYVFDINGRMLHHDARADATESYAIPSTGVYIVKVVGTDTKRVVVIR